MEWSELENIARAKASDLGSEYISKLDFEINEILKQGSGDYWVELYLANKKFDHNKNGLVIAYLLDISNKDPIKHSYVVEDGDGDDDLVIIKYDNSEVKIPANVLVRTKRGDMLASDLQIGDEII